MIQDTVSTFERKYTDDQRDAMANAYEDRRIRPARRVVELAAAGELEHNGERLEPFDANEDTVRDLARDLRRRRSGNKTSQLAQQPPRDAIEALRRRLVNMADGELQAEEKKKPGTRDAERMRQLARAIREAAAIPGPTDPRPPAPGARKDGERNGAETRGGLGGAIIAAHRGAAAQTEPAPDVSTPLGDNTESASSGAATNAHSDTETSDDGSPGAAVRALADELGYAESAAGE